MLKPNASASFRFPKTSGRSAALLAVLLPLFLGSGYASQSPEKIYPLPEITSVFSIQVAGDKLFIVDARTREISVYSLDGIRFLGRIGKSGQGPGEFDSPPRLAFLPDGFAAKSFAKLEFFSKDWKALRESKGFGVDLMVSGFPVFPLDGRYVAFPFVRDESNRMTECLGRIYDADWKPVRDFTERFPSPTPPPPPPPGSKSSGPKQKVLLIKDYCDGAVAGGRIYFADSRKGLSITVFDVKGEKLREIKPSIKPPSVSRKEREDLLSAWREEMKKFLDSYDPVVPDSYPAFFAFRMDGDEIHAVTSVRKGDLYEVITMDLEGKILRRSFAFPLEPSWGYLPGTNSRFDIRSGILYTVDYNDSEERYELGMTTLK
jgi:hypothetical protein